MVMDVHRHADIIIWLLLHRFLLLLLLFLNKKERKRQVPDGLLSFPLQAIAPVIK